MLTVVDPDFPATATNERLPADLSISTADLVVAEDVEGRVNWFQNISEAKQNSVHVSKYAIPTCRGNCNEKNENHAQGA